MCVCMLNFSIHFRYFATLHPLSSANTWLRSHYNLVLLMGWILGSLLASISVQNVQVAEFSLQNITYKDCRHWVGMSEHEMKIYVSTSFVLTFVLPMTFLTISYGAIGRRLLRAQQHWCSFNQTAPFSLHTASRTHSSGNSNCSGSSNTLNNGSASRNNAANGKLDLNSLSNGGQSGSIKGSSFVRHKQNNNNNNNNKQSLKTSGANVRGITTIKLSRTKSNQSLDFLPNNNNNNNNNKGTGQHRNHNNKSVKMYTSQDNIQGDANVGKVMINFDRRNAEFLNKMRVSI